jgi:hypothetical protein
VSGSNEGFGSIGHLAIRFFGSLRPGGPPAADDSWALAQLEPGEQALWRRMSGPDRRHAVGVARDAIAILESSAPAPTPRPVVAAALLHDVGKIQSGLGTWARAAVTIVAMAVGRERVASWSPAPPAPDNRAPDNRAPDNRARDNLAPDDPVPGRRLPARVAAGRYVTHDRIGASLLLHAGSDPLTVAWAREHHQPETAWTVDRRTADALKAADGD